jgi:hypothetical protein
MMFAQLSCKYFMRSVNTLWQQIQMLPMAGDKQEQSDRTAGKKSQLSESFQ